MKREVDFYVFCLLKQRLGIERTVVTLNTWHTDVWVSIISASSRSSSSTIRRSSHYFTLRGKGRGGSACLRGVLFNCGALARAKRVQRSTLGKKIWLSMRPPFHVSWVKFPLMYHFRQKRNPFHIFILLLGNGAPLNQKVFLYFSRP